MSRSVVIVAGGSGTRMGVSTPKQFLPIAGKPILIHTIEAFFAFDPAIQVVIVLPKDHQDTWQKFYHLYFPKSDIEIAFGGSSRFQSVKSGLARVTNELVAIHDAVRPMIPVNVIKDSFEAAARTGSGVVMVPSKDSLRIKTDSETKSVDRSQYYIVQTPQTFQTKRIKEAFEVNESPLFTDDASVYESAGGVVTNVMGAYENTKITTRADLMLAEYLLSKK